MPVGGSYSSRWGARRLFRRRNDECDLGIPPVGPVLGPLHYGRRHRLVQPSIYHQGLMVGEPGLAAGLRSKVADRLLYAFTWTGLKGLLSI